jgi:hypothetical protein
MTAPSGPSGFGVTVLRCPDGHHMVTVYRTAEGELFAPGPGGALHGDALVDVQCRACGRSYPVNPAALRRAAWERRGRLVLRR